MEMRAARIVAEREMESERTAICITSGLSVMIRWIAWFIPCTISSNPVHSHDITDPVPYRTLVKR